MCVVCRFLLPIQAWAEQSISQSMISIIAENGNNHKNNSNNIQLTCAGFLIALIVIDRCVPHVVHCPEAIKWIIIACAHATTKAVSMVWSAKEWRLNLLPVFECACAGADDAYFFGVFRSLICLLCGLCAYAMVNVPMLLFTNKYVFEGEHRPTDRQIDTRHKNATPRIVNKRNQFSISFLTPTVFYRQTFWISHSIIWFFFLLLRILSIQFVSVGNYSWSTK